MRIEAFSEARRPRCPERNEDAFVVIPGRAYAVIDGATDRSGRRYAEGATSGQLAARAVAAVIHALFGASSAPRFDPAAVVEAATEAIAMEYRRLGMLALAAQDRNSRFNATLALAVPQDGTLHLLLVGDSGIRVNRTALYRESKLLDAITASLRVAAYRHLAARGVAQPEIDALAARVTFRGTRHCAREVGAALCDEDLAAIEASVLADHLAAHPPVPPDMLRALVQGGILSGQAPHQNDAASALGYSCLDGFAVPAVLTRSVDLPMDDIRDIELFTDGYFAPGDTVGLASWEAMFAQVEREDPHKIGRFPSVKGSGADGTWSDDRTYLHVVP